MDWIIWPLAVIGYLVIAIISFISINFRLKVSGEGTKAIQDEEVALLAGIFWPLTLITFCAAGLYWTTAWMLRSWSNWEKNRRIVQ